MIMTSEKLKGALLHNSIKSLSVLHDMIIEVLLSIGYLLFLLISNNTLLSVMMR